MTKFTTFAAAALILSLTACGGSAPDAGPPPLEGARMGGAFSLINQDGKTTTEKDFAGKYRLIYFGYTFCPDICPVDAQLMGQALTLLEKEDRARAAKLVPIFISVDPARDTPTVVKQFVSNFHPRMVGLTGSVAQIDEMAQRYGVAFMREKPNAQGAYLVNHARMIVLYGPQGEPIAIMPQGDDPKAIVAELSRWVR
jgi:protein SCO1/2